MKTKARSLNFLVPGIMVLISILACDLSPYTTSVPTVPAPRAIYVATTGHDTATCGPAATPCLTVTQGVARAVAGSTIHIGAGSFVERAAIPLPVPLTFIGASRTGTVLGSRGSNLFNVALAVDIHMQDLAVANLPGASSNALVLQGGNASIEMLRVNVQNNAGVGLLVPYGSLVSIDHCLFSGNVVGIESHGGLQVTNSDFQGNRRNAIFSSGVSSIQGTTFEQNGTGDSTGNGTAAVVNSKLSDTEVGTMSISQSIFSNNPGMGAMNNGGRVSMTNVSILTSLDGISNSSGVFNISDSVIADNRFVGVNIVGPDAATQMSRVAIVRNHVMGVYLERAQVRAENITVSGSTNEGIRVGVGGSLSLGYSTVAYNTGSGINFVEPTDGQVTLSNSIVNLNGAGRDCQYPSRVTHLDSLIACDASFNASLHLGPLAAQAGTWVHPLLTGSLAIDAASGTCPATDQRAYTRPSGSACDLGAYEFGAGLHETVATPGPADTPGLIEILPTDTATLAAAPLASFNKNANCRKGPGSGYDIVTSLTSGTQTTPDGRDAQSLWLDVLVPNTQAHCWVLGSSVDLNVGVDSLPVLPTPPLPDVPANFTDKANCQIKLKSLSVKLSWSAAANASGYHVYRDGNLLASLGASTTSYTDGSAPLGKDLTYEIEAYNANGAAQRVQTVVGACK